MTAETAFRQRRAGNSEERAIKCECGLGIRSYISQVEDERCISKVVLDPDAPHFEMIWRGNLL